MDWSIELNFKLDFDRGNAGFAAVAVTDPLVSVSVEQLAQVVASDTTKEQEQADEADDDSEIE